MRGFLLFDIDGVIRDVAQSYRLAIQETVNYFISWRPTLQNIDTLKAEGCWNNDWHASMELIKRHKTNTGDNSNLPKIKEVIEIFSGFYFGGDPEGDSQGWKGFIKNEPLLVEKKFFDELLTKGFSWGFVSGAEPQSAKYVLQTRLGLKDPPLIAMGEAPDKPNPTGLLRLATQLAGGKLGSEVPPVAYIGDTVADIITIKKAKQVIPQQKFLSLAVAPPHLHGLKNQFKRTAYENQLKNAGADLILNSTNQILEKVKSSQFFTKQSID